jgi:threonine aldolase
MGLARVGDDAFGEDPTVRRLEILAANLLGKQAAVFVPSGTMANLIALLAHCDADTMPRWIVAGESSHIATTERAGLSRAGLRLMTVEDSTGLPRQEQVLRLVMSDRHAADRHVVCIENSHNRMGGVAVHPERTRQLCRELHGLGIPVHLDGARLFNSAVALGVPAHVLAQDVDSVAICLSKGLCCPAGSVLSGDPFFVERARQLRSMLGGTMRQAGVLAAAGIIGLTQMVSRLSDDHRRTARLVEGLNRIPNATVRVGIPNTNIVYVVHRMLDANEAVRRLREQGILALAIAGAVRMVVYREVRDRDVRFALEGCSRALQ